MSKDNKVLCNVDKRYIRLNDKIGSETTADIINALFEMEESKHKDDIDFYINCRGGSAYDFFAIYDVIQSMESKVNTIGLGQNMSGGCFLLMAGTGERKIYPNTRVMLHGLQCGFPWQSHEDQKQWYKEHEEIQQMVTNITVKHTGKKREKVEEDIKRDRFMSAKEALEYGMVDEIIGGKNE